MKIIKNNGKAAAVRICILVLLCISPVFAENQFIETAFAVSTCEELEFLEKSISDQPQSVRDLSLGIAMHNLSAEQPEYIDRAAAYLESAWKLSEDPLALGYLGSIQTVAAGVKSREGDLLGAVEDLDLGVSNIDAAVEMAPESVSLRFLRIFNGLDVSLSSPLSREEIIEDDLIFLARDLAEADAEFRAGYWYATGELKLMQDLIDEALNALESAVAEAPGSAYARLAADLLWELEE